MNKKLSIVTLTTTVILIIAFTALCICFIPNFAEYIAELEKVPMSENSTKATVCIMGTVLALPCLAILILALKLSKAVASDGVFTASTAKRLFVISAILLADCVLFLLPVVFLFAVGEFTVSPLLAVLDIVGFGLGVLLRVLSEYISRAAILKEEADATL